VPGTKNYGDAMSGGVPEVRYARSGDVHIAYQTWGEGDRNLVIIPGAFSHLEINWDQPSFAESTARFGRSGRVAIFDKRGTGLSDRNVGIAPLEVRMEDARAVMDACGMESATILGLSEGGPMAVLMAATYPERVDSLILYGSAPTWRARADVPGSDLAEETCRLLLAEIEEGFSEGRGFQVFSGPELDTPEARKMVGRRWRNSASPSDAVQMFRMLAGIDVCDALPLVSCPALIMAASLDPVGPAPSNRWMAEQIPQGRYEEFPGYHYCHIDPDVNERYMQLVEEFWAGASRPDPVERALATVLFTDIVSSTEAATRMGDAQWRRVLEQHDARCGAIVDRHGGRLVKSTGDGVLATFDGPGKAVRSAHDIISDCRELGIELRAGLHCGEVEVRPDGDVSGLAVHIASRVESAAAPGEVLVSRTVADLTIGSELRFASRGEHALKGVEGAWELFRSVA